MHERVLLQNTVCGVNAWHNIDTTPFISDSRTFVLIASIALALGCKVSWVISERKILILKG